MLKQLSVAIVLAGVALGTGAVELTEEQRAAVAERLSPVGSLCLQGDSGCANGPVTVDPSTRRALAPDEPEAPAQVAEASAPEQGADTAGSMADAEQMAEAAEDLASEAAGEAVAAAAADAGEQAGDAMQAAEAAMASAADEVTEAADEVAEATAETTADAAEAVDAAAAQADSAAMEVAEAVSVGESDIDGEAIYSQACVACHMSGVGGAPILGNTEMWAPRIAKGKEALYQSGLNGVAGTAMIAKGGRMDLSDEQIKAAVDYMVASSQ